MNNQERVAKTYYSTHYERFMPKTLQEWENFISGIALNFDDCFDPMPRDGLILDVPCGVGYMEHYLLKRGFTKIDAVDLCEEQIQVAKIKLQEHRLDFATKVTFHGVDAFDFLKKTQDRYMAIAMIDFLEHLGKDKIIDILDLAYNALQTDGVLCLRVINADNPIWGRFFYRDFTHETPFTPDTLRHCLTLTGFETVKIDYEKIPCRPGLIAGFKKVVRYTGLLVLGKFLGSVPPNAFTPNLIAVGKKR